MVKLAIRDDDMNFFTKVEDVEKVYEDIPDFPISFAVIPTVTDVSTKGKCPDTKGNQTPRWIGENTELISWLKQRLNDGKADVLLHGITHSYKYQEGKRLAEMQWRKEEDLTTEIKDLKKRMEEILDYPISVFVAPSNKISKYGIKCIAANDMDFSGIVPITFERDFTLQNIKNYAKRWYIRAKDKFPYPNVLQYNNHRELNACLLQGYDYLVSMYNYCQRIGSPMAVNVHYWHLRDNPVEKAMLMDFVKYSIDQGAVPATISELFRDKS